MGERLTAIGELRRLEGPALAGLVIVLCAFAAAPAHVEAARELDPRDCISDEGDPADCGVTQEGLDGASKLAISPDGASVYVASAGDDAIVHLRRDEATGKLTPQGCISDVGDPPGCDVTQQGLDGANDVAVSPDGSSVYAVSRWDDAVVRFERDPATGQLTPKGCIADVPNLAGCDVEQQGLSGPAGVIFAEMAIEVSPDGSFVYVFSPGRTAYEEAKLAPEPGEPGEHSNAPAISRFARDTNAGQLTPDGCVSSYASSYGFNCGSTDMNGLGVGSGFTISPDGTSMYVSAVAAWDRTPPAVSHFGVDTSTGELIFEKCIASEFDELSWTTSCHARGEGIGASALAISPGGASVYNSGSGLVRLSRGSDGTITYEDCISRGSSSAECQTYQEGLYGFEDLAVAPDGMSLYGVGGGRIWRLLRDPGDGALSPQGCVGETGPLCTPWKEAFAAASGVVVGPDSASVYVASEERDTVVHLGLAPGTSIDSGPSGPTNDPTPRFEFSSEEPSTTFECRWGTSAFGPCTGPGQSHKREEPFPDGEQSFEVRAIDPDGTDDPSPAKRTFVVDTVAPSLTIDLTPPARTADTTPAFGFSRESGATVACSIDSGVADFGSCSGGGGHAPVVPLPDGDFIFRVRATDSAGNQATRLYAFTVDTTPPGADFSSGPSRVTGDSTPRFEFSAAPDVASLECRQDDGAWFECSNPYTTYALADGPHRLRVRGTDTLGNVDTTPASRRFTVDTEIDDPLYRIPKMQRQRGRWVKVKIWTGAGERVRAKVTGKVKVEGKRKTFKLKRKTKRIKGGDVKRLRLKPKNRKQNRKVRKAIRRDKRGRGVVKVKLTDRHDHSDRIRRRVKLVAKRR